MEISTRLMGKQILEGILDDSNLRLRLTNIKNIDYLINENIGIKVVVRNRVNVNQKGANDSFYIKLPSIKSFDKACEDNNLSPYYCIVQILEDNINILLFSLQKARKDITDSGLNVKIQESTIKDNICIYEGVLWRYLRKGQLYINNNFIKDNIQLIFVEEDVELDNKLFYRNGIAETIKGNLKIETEDNSDYMNIKSYNNLSNEINDINNLNNLSPTEKEQLVKSRIGHSKLKKLLINKDCKCIICGLNDERFLIASHIQRWSVSDDNERRDINNVFLLCPDHDWLFDKFYISLDDDGNILLADSVEKVIYEKLKISSDINKVSLNNENKKYLKWHREQFNKKKA